ncbi:hypothetical protein [Janthinobacterium sp. RT4P48]|uniref:hypothetical protein n=1 Tax=Janthinobacterium sp. RT4P48 TaxID=3424188 RepID=UPI003F2030DC
MNDNLSVDEIAILLTSLEYSRQRIRDADGTPLKIRNDELTALEKIAEKLRINKKRLSDP